MTDPEKERRQLQQRQQKENATLQPQLVGSGCALRHAVQDAGEGERQIRQQIVAPTTERRVFVAEWDPQVLTRRPKHGPPEFLTMT